MRSLHYSSVHVDDELPPLPIPLTPSVIVAGAIASRDYQDVHHDPALAREKGSPDIFMNILTTNGYIGRYVTDWAGPDAIVKKVAIRLGAPNYPGDTMTITGKVTRTEDGANGAGTVDVAVIGANGLGNHVTGTVTVELPA
jgi:acyl dehydratase